MSKKSTIAEQIASLAKPIRNGYASWFEKLPPELKPHFAAALEQYDPDRFQQAAYARAVVEVCRQHNVPIIPTKDTVCRWLRTKRRN